MHPAVTEAPLRGTSLTQPKECKPKSPSLSQKLPVPPSATATSQPTWPGDPMLSVTCTGQRASNKTIFPQQAPSCRAPPKCWDPPWVPPCCTIPGHFHQTAWFSAKSTCPWCTGPRKAPGCWVAQGDIHVSPPSWPSFTAEAAMERLLLVRREAAAEFPFPWLGRPWWCHTAVLGQPRHCGRSGARCSAQKGNLQPSPVRARARGFSAGFLSLPLPLILSSRFLEMKQTQAPVFCVALVGVTALLLHSPVAAVGIFGSGWLHLAQLLPLLPTPRDGTGQCRPQRCCVLHPSNGQQLRAVQKLSVHPFLLCNDRERIFLGQFRTRHPRGVTLNCCC